MGNSGLSSHDGKQFNMATVVSECAAVLCCLLEAVQAIEDPSSFQNFYTWVDLQRFDNPENNGNSPLSSTSTSKSGGFLCCVPGYFTHKKRNTELYSDMYRGVIFCAFIVSR